MCLFIPATRKRVYILFERQLFHRLIFRQLILNIRCYCACIRSCRIDIVTSTPEMPIPIFVLQVCRTIKDHQGTFSFQVSHKLRHTQIRWNTYQHMNVVRTSLCFQYFYLFQIAQLTQDFSDIFFDLSIDYLTTIFGHKYNVILAFPGCV